MPVKFIISCISIGFAALILMWAPGFRPAAAAAADPRFFISWRAETYAPPTYPGKNLPVNNAAVTVAFELLDGGRPADLSQQPVQWRLNNTLYRSGLGLQTIAFTVEPLQRANVSVTITLPRYRNGLEQAVVIPVVEPEAVIDLPYPRRAVTTGANLFRGLPYFFTVNSPTALDIQWTANGQVAPGRSGAPDLLALTVPAAASGSTIALNFSVKNKNNRFEFADGSLTVTVD